MKWYGSVSGKIFVLLALLCAGCSDSDEVYRESPDGSGAILYVGDDIALLKIIGRVQLVKAKYLGKPTWGWSTGDSIEETLVDDVDRVFLEKKSGNLVLKVKTYSNSPAEFYIYNQRGIESFRSKESLVERLSDPNIDFDSAFLEPDEFFEKYK